MFSDELVGSDSSQIRTMPSLQAVVRIVRDLDVSEVVASEEGESSRMLKSLIRVVIAANFPPTVPRRRGETEVDSGSDSDIVARAVDVEDGTEREKMSTRPSSVETRRSSLE